MRKFFSYIIEWYVVFFSVVHYINEDKQKVVEGELRITELSEYLKKLNAPRKVWLSEDGTGIVPKIEYDQVSNQLTGLVLPISQITGMPISGSFLARSNNEIARHMNKPMSTHIYIVMAQPLKENVPPFLLLVFGTDNKFKSISVLQRWKFIRLELEK